jgi:hypothetical protein
VGDHSFAAPRESAHLLCNEEVPDGSTDGDGAASTGPGGRADAVVVEQHGARLASIAVAACTVGAASALDESSDDALAAAASARWCEVEPVAVDLPSATPVERAETDRAADGGRALVTCGLWLARRRLVAAVLGPGGEARRVIRAALTDDARFGLVEYLAAAGAELVATEALARVDLMPVQAARRGLAVRTVGDVAALLRAAAIRDPPRAEAFFTRDYGDGKSFRPLVRPTTFTDRASRQPPATFMPTALHRGPRSRPRRETSGSASSRRTMAALWPRGCRGSRCGLPRGSTA